MLGLRFLHLTVEFRDSAERIAECSGRIRQMNVSGYPSPIDVYVDNDGWIVSKCDDPAISRSSIPKISMNMYRNNNNY